jgi:NAD-dependent deacetylase sirtuin 2
MGQTPSFCIDDVHPAERAGVLGGAPSLAAVAERIADGRIRNVVVLAGAGLSVAAGIPDFRSPGSGLYDNLARYKLPAPEAVFSIDYFSGVSPRPFFHLARDMYPGAFLPTRAHYLLRLLAEKGVLRRVYTQNIDTLERVAGVPAELLVEAHGSFATATCTGCGRGYDQAWVEAALFGGGGGGAGGGGEEAGEPDLDGVVVPSCELCGAVVKPDITFFGESLPPRYGQLVRGDAAAADCLLVLGTSLKVHPVAGIPDTVGRLCPRVLINREPVHAIPPPPPPPPASDEAGGQAGAGSGSDAGDSGSGTDSDASSDGDSEHGSNSDGGGPVDSSSAGSGSGGHKHAGSDSDEGGDRSGGQHRNGRKAHRQRHKHRGHAHAGPVCGCHAAAAADNEADPARAERRAARAAARLRRDMQALAGAGGGGAAHPGSWGFRFFLPDNYRDVLVQGDCDAGAEALARALGWWPELQALHEAETARLRAAAEASGRLARGRAGASPAGEPGAAAAHKPAAARLAAASAPAAALLGSQDEDSKSAGEAAAPLSDADRAAYAAAVDASGVSVLAQALADLEGLGGGAVEATPTPAAEIEPARAGSSGGAAAAGGAGVGAP